MNWIEGLQNALKYIEAHLTDDLGIEEIAACAYVSPFHFQRIFSAICGMTVGEYIRCRRLALAAEALASSREKVIDVALRFGYDSPDSFTRAFTRFHGVPPSAAKERGVSLRSFAPLRISLTLEGGTMLEYKIVEKQAFTVMGVKQSFQEETSYQDIPAFWQEYLKGANKPVCGTFGVCLDSNVKQFDYLIADLYKPWHDVPDGCCTHTFAAGTWAVFPCRGALPDALQSVNTRIWKEWLPACRDYRLGGNFNIEMYALPAEKPEDNYCEIWVPLVKAQ